MKYLVIPGDMISRTDGDIHYISGPQLCQLYKVDPKDCYFIHRPEDELGLDRSKFKGVLTPDYTGKYNL